MGDDKIKNLYEAASKSYDLGTEEEFRQKLQSPEKRKAFYEAANKEFDLGDYDTFESKVSLKKKESTVSDLSATSPLEGGTSSSTTGVSEPTENPLQQVNESLNPPGVLNPTNPLVAPKPLLPPINEDINPAGTVNITDEQNATNQKVLQEKGLGVIKKKFDTDIANHPYQASFISAASNWAGKLARTPAFIADALNQTINTVVPGSALDLPTDESQREANNPIATPLEEMSKHIDSVVDAKDIDASGKQLDVTDYFNPKSEHYDLGKGARRLGIEAAKMLPIAIGYATGAATGMSEAQLAMAGSSVFGAQEKKDLIDQRNNTIAQNEINKQEGKPEIPVMDDNTMQTVSTISGAINGVGEAVFGNVKFGQVFKKMFTDKVSEETIKKSLKTILWEATKKYGITSGEEGLTEGAQQLFDNLNHKYIGGQSDVNPMDGVMQNIIVGSGVGLGMGAAPTAMHIAITRKEADKANKHAKTQEVAKEQLANPNNSTEEKEAARITLEQSFKDEDKDTGVMQKEWGNLPESKKWEIGQNLLKIDKLHDAINKVKNSADPNITEESRKAIIDEHLSTIASIDAENEAIKKENNKIVEAHEKSTIDENAVSDEHENLFKEFNSTLTEKLKAENEEKVAKEKIKQEKLKTKQDAIQKQSTGSILPREQETVGETRSEGVGVGQSNEGEKPSAASNTEEKVVEVTLPPKNKIHHARHGQNIDDVNNKPSSTNAEGLNKEGKKEANSLATKAKELGINTVHVSEEDRSKQTGEAIAKKTGAKIIIDKNLNPYNIGEFKGSTDEEWKEAENYFAKHPDELEYKGKKAGETFNQFAHRVIPAMTKIENEGDAKTMVINHGAGERLFEAAKKSGAYNETARENFINTEPIDNGTIREKPIAEVKIETPVKLSKKEQRIEDIHSLQRKISRYNSLSKADKKKIGGNLLGDINASAKKIKHQIGALNKGNLTLLNSKGKKVYKETVKRSKEEIAVAKEQDKLEKRALNADPVSVEHQVVMDIANGVKFNHDDLIARTGIAPSEIPLGLTTKTGGVSFEEYQKRIAEHQGTTLGDETDIANEAADIVAEYAQEGFRAKAKERAIEIYNGATSFEELNALAKEYGVSEEEINNISDAVDNIIDNVSEEDIEKINLELNKTQNEYEAAERIYSDITGEEEGTKNPFNENYTGTQEEEHETLDGLISSLEAKGFEITFGKESIEVTDPDSEEEFNLPVRSPEETQAAIDKAKALLEGAEKPTGATTETKEAIKEETEKEDKGFNDKETLAKLEKDYTALRHVKNVEKKLGDVLIKLKEHVAEGKITEKKAAQYRKRFLDNVAARENTEATIRRALQRVADFINQNQNNGIIKNTIVPGMNKTVDRFCASIAEAIIEAQRLGKVGMAAVDYVLAHAKESKIYKELVRLGDIDDKTFAADFKKQYNEQTNKVEAEKVAEEKVKTEEDNKRQQTVTSEKQKSAKEEEKSVLTRLAEATGLSDKAKESMVKFGLKYAVFSNTEASNVAQSIIKEKGVEEALNIAREHKELPLSVYTMIFAHSINEFRKAEENSTNQADKEWAADHQADISNELDEFARDWGRGISAIGEFYKMSELGIQKKEISKVKAANTKQVKGKKLDKVKDKVVDLFEKIDKGNTNIQEPARTTEKKATVRKLQSRNKELFKQLKDSFKDKPTIIKNAIVPITLTHEQVKIIGEIAGNIVRIGVNKGTLHVDKVARSLKRRIKKELDFEISDTDLKRVFQEDYEEGKSISDALAEHTTEETNRAEKIAILDKLYPAKNKTARQSLKEHERLVRAYEAGAFDGLDRTYKDENGNDTKETFEDLLYEKHGIVNTSSTEFRNKMKEFAAEIKKAPAEGRLRERINQKILNYVADKQKQTWMQAKTELFMSAFFTNILSSYETQSRNIKYNSATVFLAQNTLLAEKAILDGNYKDARILLFEGFKHLGQAWTEAKDVIKTGKISRFEEANTQSLFERTQKKYLKPGVIPHRVLRGMDVMYTVPAYEMKTKELLMGEARKELKEAGKPFNDADVSAKVNEYLGNTQARRQAAEEKTNQEMVDFYGNNWRDNKEAVSEQNIRMIENMEANRPQVIKDEAEKWARRSLLTSRPVGFWGQVADILNSVGQMPGGKLLVPFVNIGCNIADRTIERTPLGFYQAWKGKKGYGAAEYHLSEDEKRELRIKATNYLVVGTGLLAAMIGCGGDKDDDALFVVTGKNTGDYKKELSNKLAHGLHPYSVYVAGHKILDNYVDLPMGGQLALLGYYRDEMKYGSGDKATAMLHSATSMMTYMLDQASLSGLKDFLDGISDINKSDLKPGKVAKATIDKLSAALVPNLLKAANNDVRGLLGLNDYKSSNWKDAFFRNIPFLESIQEERYDHLGRPILDEFKAPLVPVEKWQPKDEYYASFVKHGYYPSYITRASVYVDGKEIDIEPSDLTKLNKIRGEEVLKQLNKKEDNGKRTIDNMDELKDDKQYQTTMKGIFSSAGVTAKVKLYGNNASYNKPKK